MVEEGKRKMGMEEVEMTRKKSESRVKEVRRKREYCGGQDKLEK